MKYKNRYLSNEERVEDLLVIMTLEEKIGQLCQYPMLEYQDNKDEYLQLVREGRVGSRILADTAWAGNAPGESVDPHQINEIQKAAVEQSRLGIPVIFARDVIYGQSTVLPIPLAQACSWNPSLIESAYQSIAREASSLGINWTFAPMLDIVRDPRWGRVIESSGEDPYLTSQFAKAVVKGFQGDDPSASGKLLACAKHFVGYGASEGGRDYETTEISENTLHNVYLPPFQSAVEAGVSTLMSGFNDLAGTPVTGSQSLVREWLKGKQEFDGLVVSDWGSISDLAYFGVAKDAQAAAEMAMDAGIDMAMTHEAYADHLAQAMESGAVSPSHLDEAVSRVLLAKFRAGLFDNPYIDPELHKATLLHPEHRKKALDVAEQSLVLLKNDGTLPLKDTTKVAVVGPHAHSQRQHLGSWCLDGDSNDVISIYQGMCDRLGKDHVLTEFSALVDEWVECAHNADVVVLCVGESHRRTGEARNIAELALPAGQEAMIEAIAATGKPLVVVQCTGRPIPSAAIEANASALLYAWQSGTETGTAVANILTGRVNPSGKLSMTVPRSTGQIPYYYARKPLGKMRDFQEYQCYKDQKDSPLYPFGYGQSYSTFELNNLCIENNRLQQGDVQRVTAVLKNTGEFAGFETIQCYVGRSVSSTTQPVRLLKSFKKVWLEENEEKIIELEIPYNDFAIWGKGRTWEVEGCEVTLYVGTDSNCPAIGSFQLYSRG